MVAVIDPGSGRVAEVTEEQFRRLVDGPEGGGSALKLAGELPHKLKIWDNVDGQWTAELPQYLVFQYYLRKVVRRCTGCTFASPFDKLVLPHIDKVRQQSREHQDAKVTQVTTAGGRLEFRCGACDVPFNNRARGELHIRNLRASGPAHQGAREVAMLRYSLGPPVPPPPAVASNGYKLNGERGLEASPAVRSGEGGRRRHRSRRHRR